MNKPMPPISEPKPSSSKHKISERELFNNKKLFLIDKGNDFKLVKTSLYFNIGTLRGDKNAYYQTLLLTEVVGEQTKKHSRTALVKKAKSLCLEYEFIPSHSKTALSFTCLVEDFDQVCNLIFEILTESVVRQKEIDSAILYINFMFNQTKKSADIEQQYARILNEQIYDESSPYNIFRDPIKQNPKIEEVQELVDNSFIQDTLSHVLLAGNCSDKVVNKLRSMLASLPNKPNLYWPEIPKLNPKPRVPIIDLTKPENKANQVLIGVSRIYPEISEEAFAMNRIITFFLDNSDYSPIYKKLRKELGITYDLDCSYVLYGNALVTEIKGFFDAKAKDLVIAEIEKWIDAFKEKPINEELWELLVQQQNSPSNIGQSSFQGFTRSWEMDLLNLKSCMWEMEPSFRFKDLTKEGFFELTEKYWSKMAEDWTVVALDA